MDFFREGRKDSSFSEEKKQKDFCFCAWLPDGRTGSGQGPAFTGLAFCLWTAAASYGAVLLWDEGGLVWSDLINSNPHRPLSNTLFIMAVMVPLLTGFIVVFALSLPALAAGMCALLTRMAFRRISQWHLPVFAAICVLAFRMQLCLVATLFDPRGDGVLAAPAHAFARMLTGNVLIGAFYLLPLAWAWTRTTPTHASAAC